MNRIFTYLSGTGATRDDVSSSGTSTTPVLGGRTVNGLLGSGVGVDSGHQPLNDTELVIEDLGERSQAVGGARSVGKNVDVLVVLLEVYTADEHGGIGRGGGDDDLLGTTLQVKRGLVNGGEDTSGLDDVLSTSLGPWDVCRVALLVHLDGLSVDDQVTGLRAGDLTLEVTVGGVVLEHVDGILGVNEGVVDGKDVNVVVLDAVALILC
jgi:hypothetical protein